jgi:hypothetical protein
VAKAPENGNNFSALQWKNFAVNGYLHVSE